MNTISKHGQIITFYSYKGGAGRTMALANVACLLAEENVEAHEKVLMIDWDLEAPGLHRYFFPLLTRVTTERLKTAEALAERSHLLATSVAPSVGRRSHIETIDPKLLEGSAQTRAEYVVDSTIGLIDLFEDFWAGIRQTTPDGAVQSREAARDLIESFNLLKFTLQTDVRGLHLMKAGKFDTQSGYLDYASRASRFPWLELFNKSPYLLEEFATSLAKIFRYVLIDSRTGFTDTSGICTSLMPEKLVIVFTPNTQSLIGVSHMIRNAVRYRRESDDLRALAVFPLAARVESTVSREYREGWRLGDANKKLVGWQPQFEETLKTVYNLPECSLDAYFDETQIYHVPEYSFGETIAVRVERGSDPASLPRRYRSFVLRLIHLDAPWETLSEADEIVIARGKQAQTQERIESLRIRLGYVVVTAVIVIVLLGLTLYSLVAYPNLLRLFKR